MLARPSIHPSLRYTTAPSVTQNTTQPDPARPAAQACRDTYALVKGRNSEELRRLHLSREADFHAMMAHYSRVQAQLMQAAADMWRTVRRGGREGGTRARKWALCVRGGGGNPEPKPRSACVQPLPCLSPGIRMRPYCRIAGPWPL